MNKIIEDIAALCWHLDPFYACRDEIMEEVKTYLKTPEGIRTMIDGFMDAREDAEAENDSYTIEWIDRVLPLLCNL